MQLKNARLDHRDTSKVPDSTEKHVCTDAALLQGNGDDAKRLSADSVELLKELKKGAEFLDFVQYVLLNYVVTKLLILLHETNE